MGPRAEAAFILAALLGHTALWTGIVNRIHATGMPRWMIKSLTALFFWTVPVVPVLLAWLAWRGAAHWSFADLIHAFWRQGIYYFVPCIGVAVVVIAVWTWRRLRPSCAAAAVSDRVTVVDVKETFGHAPVHGLYSRLFTYVPGNQIFKLHVHERGFALRRLPTTLDGFSIAHVSDLHICGRIGIEYFQEVVRQTNALGADLIAITGDIVDRRECLAWLSSTLGQLRAPLGVYFVLGNHDLRPRDEEGLREALRKLELIDLGGRWIELEHRGSTIVLAGNELPWFTPAADMQSCQVEREGCLRVLLSHSPDQFEWAQRWNFDLMLAGHLHGGQVRLPVIGPILAPSWHGVKYACGTFEAGDTVMHVSRGTCGEFPLRWNCPPEISKIVLCKARP
jgi:predicted MPP superfamily phosphohydrolase